MQIDCVLLRADRPGNPEHYFRKRLAVISNKVAERAKWKPHLANCPIARCRSLYTQYNTVMPLAEAKRVKIPFVAIATGRDVKVIEG